MKMLSDLAPITVVMAVIIACTVGLARHSERVDADRRQACEKEGGAYVSSRYGSACLQHPDKEKK